MSDQLRRRHRASRPSAEPLAPSIPTHACCAGAGDEAVSRRGTARREAHSLGAAHPSSSDRLHRRSFGVRRDTVPGAQPYARARVREEASVGRGLATRGGLPLFAS